MERVVALFLTAFCASILVPLPLTNSTPRRLLWRLLRFRPDGAGWHSGAARANPGHGLDRHSGHRIHLDHHVAENHDPRLSARMTVS